MKKLLFILASFSLFVVSGFAQTGVAINSTGDDPDGSAMLDVSSTVKGLLVPRMTNTERIAIVTPATGLLVYQTDSIKGFYYYDGAAWTNLALVNFDESNYSYSSKTGVQLKAANVATDVDLVLSPKGAGAVLVQQPDGNATGGNNRGAGAVDFQKSRSTADRVASGENAFIGGGSSNTASGSHSTVVGGFNNLASHYLATISGGSANTASSNFATVGGGNSNVASGFASCVNGGYFNNATANFSAASGGVNNMASGKSSFVAGEGNTAQSWGETALGLYSTLAGGNPTVFVATDRILAIGNGISESARSDAFTVLKSGNVVIGGTITINGNGSSTSSVFPSTRGSNGQYLLTDGSGTLSWSNLSGNLTGNVSGTAANVTGIVAGANGGTGVANTGKTITLGGNFTLSGAFSTTLTATNTTSVTLPTTGTLATLAGTETLTNKTLAAASNTITGLTNSNLSGAAGITDANLATISTAGKVSNSATTATSSNSVNAIVARDGSGNFSAGTISASLSGNATNVTGIVAGANGGTGVANTGKTITLGGNLITSGAYSTTLTSTNTTSVTLPTSGTLATLAGNETLSNKTIAAASNTISGLTNSNLSGTAGITDANLAVISTSGKVSNSATTAVSANTNNAIVARDGSGNFSASTITATLSGNATTATTATHIAGGAQGSMPYQTASGTTSLLAKGTAGQVLRMNTGATAPEWANPYTGLTNFTESNYTYSSKTGVKFLATNAAAHVDLVISPKGEGGVLAHQPSGTSAGGNNRGANAVDWQTVRTSASQVASGAKAVISGGNENTAGGTGSTVIGGTANTASGDYSIAGGIGNTAANPGETVIGMYSTLSLAGTPPDAAPSVRIFNIGNGYAEYRSDAFSVFSTGDTKVGGQLTVNKLIPGNTFYFPAYRGTNGQMLVSDGTGGTYWYTPYKGLTSFSENSYDYDSKSGIILLANYIAPDVDFVISPRGAGALLTQKPDGTKSGGSSRGKNGVDLQTARTEAGQVAAGNYSVISGGAGNSASGDYSAVSGGRSNHAGAAYATVNGGYSNNAHGEYSVISGGTMNSAGGIMAAVLGGGFNTASGNNSAVLYGNYLNTNSKPGTVMIGDMSTTTPTLADAQNQFMTRFAGGYKFYTKSDLSAGVLLPANGNSWSTISDSTRKENYKCVDEESILISFRNLRLGSWNYKGQQKELFRHYGAMAQEWHSTFGFDGVGRIGCDTLLATADVDGIAYIAIKGLEKRTAEQEMMISSLQQEIKALKAALASSHNLHIEIMEKFAELSEKLDRLVNSQSYSGK